MQVLSDGIPRPFCQVDGTPIRGLLKNQALLWVTVGLSKPLHTRAKAVAQRQTTSISQLIRDALDEKLAYLEAKANMEEAKAKAEKEAKAAARQPRAVKPIAPLGEGRTTSLLRPLEALRSTLAPTQTPVAAGPDPLAQLYVKHAKHIAEAAAFPYERRMRLTEAISDIKKQLPVTHPNEDHMALVLDDMATKYAAKVASPPEHIVAPAVAPDVAQEPDPSAHLGDEDKVERVIDTSRLRSFGDV